MSDSTDDSQGAGPTHPDGIIDLFAYFRVLWKYRVLILAGTLIPAVVAAVFYLRAGAVYAVTYEYAHERLRPKEFKALASRFFSTANLTRLQKRLEEQQAPDMAAAISRPGIEGKDSRAPVRLRIWPDIITESGSSRSQADETQKILQLTSELLLVRVTADSTEKAAILGKVVLENFENELVLYEIIDELSRSVSESRSRLAELEEKRFAAELAVSVQKRTLDGLKALETSPTVDYGDQINLQFSLENQTDFLPLSFHMSAIEMNIVQMEERARSDTQMYSYYRDLLAAQQCLIEEAKEHLSSNQGLTDFIRFMNRHAEDEPAAGVRNYLTGHLKRLENKISLRKPITDAPHVENMGVPVVKKVCIVSAASLTGCIVGAFAAEAFRRRPR